MKNNKILVAEEYCPKCDTIMVISNSGKKKGKHYIAYKCPKCKRIKVEGLER